MMPKLGARIEDFKVCCNLYMAAAALSFKGEKHKLKEHIIYNRMAISFFFCDNLMI